MTGWLKGTGLEVPLNTDRVTHLIVTVSFNSLRPSDAIWRQRTRSTLAHKMACCLTAPSQYLNQCWLIISEVQWHSYKGIFTRDASITNHQNLFENYMSIILFKFPRGQGLNVSMAMPEAVISRELLRSSLHRPALLWQIVDIYLVPTIPILPMRDNR